MEKEKVIDKLRKLKAMADSGTDGGAINAGNLFKTLIAKYGIQESDLYTDDNRVEAYGFTKLDNECELTLFCQIVGKVMGKYDEIVAYSDALVVQCTLTQRLEISEMFNFYLGVLMPQLNSLIDKHEEFMKSLQKKADAAVKRLNKNMATTTKAFVYANDLFPPSALGNTNNMTDAEIRAAEKIARKASRMKPTSFRKALNN